MSNAFLYRMPVGIAGTITRAEHATVEPGIFNASYPCLAYGIFVQVSAGKVIPIASGNTIANLKGVGLLARPFPINDVLGALAGSEALNAGTPPVIQTADVLKRGYMMVKVTAFGGTALASIVKGDPVYARTTVSTYGLVGDIEAGTVAGNEIVSGAYFMGTPDSDGNTEIAFNI